MSRLPEFTCLAPSKIEEACSILKEHGDRTVPLAGGTDLIMHLKNGLLSPAYLLSMRNLTGLNGFRHDGGQDFVIGAMCTLTNVSSHTFVRSMLPALAEAAQSVGSPQIRNRGTIGGNVSLNTRCWYYNRSRQWRSSFPPCFKAGGDLCHVVKGAGHCFALFQADTAPSLLVMKARVKLVKEGEERVVPLAEFYSGRGESPNHLAAGELLTEILVPCPPPFSGSVYLKYRKRGSIDFPTLGVSSMVCLDRDRRRCVEARFAFCGVGMGPALVDATDSLAGMDEPRLTEDRLEYLGHCVNPVSHMGTSASLKRRFVQVLLQRAFHEAWIRAQESRTNSSGRIS